MGEEVSRLRGRQAQGVVRFAVDGHETVELNKHIVNQGDEGIEALWHGRGAAQGLDIGELVEDDEDQRVGNSVEMVPVEGGIRLHVLSPLTLTSKIYLWMSFCSTKIPSFQWRRKQGGLFLPYQDKGKNNTTKKPKGPKLTVSMICRTTKTNKIPSISAAKEELCHKNQHDETKPFSGLVANIRFQFWMLKNRVLDKKHSSYKTTNDHISGN